MDEPGLEMILADITVLESGGLIGAICGAHFARCGAKVVALRQKESSMGAWDHGKEIVTVGDDLTIPTKYLKRADIVIVENGCLGAVPSFASDRRTTLNIELLPKATMLNAPCKYTEAILQGFSGISQYVGSEEKPRLLETPVVSISAGMLAFVAGLTSELQGYRAVTVSVLGVMAYLMSPLFAAEDYGAAWGGHHVMGKFDPVNVGWQTRDGSLYFIFGKADDLTQFATDVNLTRVLALDPKIALGTVGTGPLVPAYHDDYENVFVKFSTQEIMQMIQARGGWVTPILRYEDVIDGEQVRATSGFIAADGMKLPALPYRFIA